MVAPSAPADLTRMLLEHDRWDLILDLCERDASLWRLQFLISRLRLGGSLYLQQALAQHQAAGAVEVLDRMAQVRSVQRSIVIPPGERRDRRPRPEQEIHAMAASISINWSDYGGPELTVVSEHLSRLPEKLADEVLGVRRSVGTVICRHRPATLSARGSFASTRDTDHPLTEITSPAVSLRVYHDVTCLPRQVAFTSDLLLPDSYRDPYSRRAPSPALANWSDAAVKKPTVGHSRRLDGHYFYLDNINRGHFGHALTEQLSKLWSLDAALAKYPGLRFLLMGESEEIAAWERDLYAAAGVPPDRLLAVSEPARVQHLVAASPMYVIGKSVRPEMAGVYDRVGTNLIKGLRAQRSRGSSSAGAHIIDCVGMSIESKSSSPTTVSKS